MLLVFWPWCICLQTLWKEWWYIYYLCYRVFLLWFCFEKSMSLIKYNSTNLTYVTVSHLRKKKKSNKLEVSWLQRNVLQMQFSTLAKCSVYMYTTTQTFSKHAHWKLHQLEQLSFTLFTNIQLIRCLLAHLVSSVLVFCFFEGKRGSICFCSYVCWLCASHYSKDRLSFRKCLRKRNVSVFFFLLGGFSRILVSINIVAEIIGHYGLCLFVLLCAYVRFVCMHVCVRVHAYVRMCG